jgi:hypothetical protein
LTACFRHDERERDESLLLKKIELGIQIFQFQKCHHKMMSKIKSNIHGMRGERLYGTFGWWKIGDPVFQL